MARMSEGDRRAIVSGVLDIPLHRALGVRLIDPERPADGVEMDIGELSRNNTGILHGGVVPMLLDVSCYLAALETLEAGTHAVTVNLSTSLLTGASEGVLACTGQLDRQGRSLLFLSARAMVGDRLVATAQVVKSVVGWSPAG